MITLPRPTRQVVPQPTREVVRRHPWLTGTCRTAFPPSSRKLCAVVQGGGLRSCLLTVLDAPQLGRSLDKHVCKCGRLIDCQLRNPGVEVDVWCFDDGRAGDGFARLLWDPDRHLRGDDVGVDGDLGNAELVVAVAA